MAGMILLIGIVLFMVMVYYQPAVEDPAKRTKCEKFGRSAGKVARNILDYGDDT